MMPDWVKTTLGFDTENKADGSQPTIYSGTDAPIVPDVASMQTMQAQSKGNSNTNISRQQNFYINTNSPAVADQVVTSASDSMSSEDRAISMASQGATW